MRRTWLLCVLAGAAIGACRESAENTAPPTFRDEVGPLLAAKCASCHGTEGGYSVETYLSTIACGASGLPANSASDPPILRALDRAPHVGLLTPEERALLERWIAAGSPSFRGAVHDPAFADPRSEGNHAKFLRARSWKPMLDAKDPDACGRCHDGAPARPADVRFAAPGATACTTCHAEPNGPLACTTCHGSKGKPYPPRDACFHPEAKPDASHPVHVAKYACSTCHPVANDMTGTHGDGHVEVWLDQNLAGVGARFDSGACTTQCHAGPGAKRPKPSWSDTAKMVCGDCHAAPPAGHYVGACASCHQDGPLHVNGRVDLGDGSGKCGACHGTGDNPLPKTGAHAIHANPKDAQPVACTTCHELPSGKHPLGGGASVRLIGLAATGGLSPSYDATTKTCSNVYCHAVGGGTTPTPQWTGTLGGCNSCHGLPPSPPHAANPSCGTTNCHEGKVESGVLTKDGIAHHVNGTIELR
ncbi:MAG: CxxxxCH/CxxCH domain c-type cytochrome [Polyangiales bacterium]